MKLILVYMYTKHKANDHIYKMWGGEEFLTMIITGEKGCKRRKYREELRMCSGIVNQRNDIDINLTLHVLFLSRFIQTTCLCRDLSSSGLGCKLMTTSLP